MRVLYFNDQTEEFYDTPKDIYFLGSLYLKGKPYTNPKEAVDKEYVDNAFDNITSDNITEKIPASAYPAFGGDLTNKAKTNNFTLKAVGKAGRYHKPTFDTAGRITGGKTGKLTLNKDDISGIDFGKIQFLPKEDWDSINDWTKGFDRTKYLMLDDKTINFKNPVSINEPKIINENMVINEDQVMEVSKEFFNGTLSNIKTDGLDRIENIIEDITPYYNVGGLPWKNQINFTPNHNDPVGGLIKRIPIRDIWIPQVTTKVAVIDGHLVIWNNVTGEDSNERLCLELNEDGSLKEPFVDNKDLLPNTDWASISGTSQHSEIYLHNDRVILLAHDESLNSYAASFVWRDNEGKFTNKRPKFRSGLPPKTISKNRIYYLSTSINAGTRHTMRTQDWATLLYLKSDVSFSMDLFFAREPAQVHIGNYYYKWGSSRSNTNSYKAIVPGINKISRISTINEDPFGEWIEYNLDGYIPEGRPNIITIEGMIIIISHLDDTSVERGNPIRLTYIDVSKSGELSNVRSRELTSGNSLPKDVAISKNHLYIVDRLEIQVFEFRAGGKNDYREESMFDFVDKKLGLVT